MAAPGFFFTGEETLTPAAVDRKRMLLNALRRDNLSSAPVQHWTQALARVTGALGDTLEERQINRSEKSGVDENKAAIMAALVLGGSASPAAPSAAAGLPSPQPAAAPPAVSRETNMFDDVAAQIPREMAGPPPGAPPGTPAMAMSGGSSAPASLVQSESGGNWRAQNAAMGAGGMPGHFGRLQFGQARIQDAIRAGALPPGTTPQAFMASPQLQQAAERWHFADIDKAIQSGPAAAAIGRAINGVPVTQEGLRAVAHLGGTGGMNKFVQSNGAYNPADANGTSLLAYLQRHGGAGQPGAPAVPQGQPSSPQAPVQGGQGGLAGNPQAAALLQALSSPWAARNPVLAQIGQQVLGQQIAGTKLTYQTLPDGTILALDPTGRRAPTPVYQAPVRPQFGVTGEVDGNKQYGFINPATQQVTPYNPGTGAPTSTRLPDGRMVQLPTDAAARKKFLEELGTAGAKSVTGAPDAIKTADISLGVLDQLIGSPDGKRGEHPGLQSLFGLTGKLPTYPGSKKADAEALLAQIKDRSFLAGIESMRGTGAITEAEGAKATGAIARLNTSQSPAAFKQSLMELREILQSARARNATIAGGGVATPAQPVPQDGGRLGAGYVPQTAAGGSPAADPLGIR